MSESLFTKIIRGDIPSHKVYEDPHVFAFLDINPLAPGHTLVIPKEPARTLDALSDDAAAAVGRALPRICRALKKLTGVAAFNVLQNNEPEAHQAVFHVHFHIIPKPSPDRGLQIGWPTSAIDHAEGAALAEKLREEIGRAE